MGKLDPVGTIKAFCLTVPLLLKLRRQTKKKEKEKPRENMLGEEKVINFIANYCSGQSDMYRQARQALCHVPQSTVQISKGR